MERSRFARRRGARDGGGVELDNLPRREDAEVERAAAEQERQEDQEQPRSDEGREEEEGHLRGTVTVTVTGHLRGARTTRGGTSE